MEKILNSNKSTARIFGIFFILAFLSYGVGYGMLQSLIGYPVSLSAIDMNKSKVVSELVLMGIIQTVLTMGVAVIMFSILKKWSNKIAYGYLSAAIISSSLLVLGVVFLFLLIPISEQSIQMGTINNTLFQTISMLCFKGNFYAYQIGMSIWGLGGLMLCYLLYKSKLVPRFISIWGFTGYIIFILGTILVLFGFSENTGVMMDIPGGLFELFLSFWAIVKGFNTIEAPKQN